MALKAQCNKGDRGILLVIAQVAGWSCCSWSGASVFVFSVQLDSPVHTQFAVGIDLHKIQLAVDHLQNVTTAKSGGLHCSTWHIKATNNQKLKLTVTTERNLKLFILTGYATCKYRETNFGLLSWWHTLM
jgi:hypothetical protein